LKKVSEAILKVPQI